MEPFQGRLWREESGSLGLQLANRPRAVLSEAIIFMPIAPEHRGEK
jgi:hypothetical protein